MNRNNMNKKARAKGKTKGQWQEKINKKIKYMDES